MLTDGATRLSTIELIDDQIARHQSKPLDMQQLAENIDALLDESESAPETHEPTPTVRPAAAGPRAGPSHAQELVGDAPAIRRVRELAAEVADTDMTILIRGESGVGKGVVARMIHQHSQRHPKTTW